MIFVLVGAGIFCAGFLFGVAAGMALGAQAATRGAKDVLRRRGLIR